MNAPQRILQAICDEFDVDIVSEYEPQFWGFKTQEEWDAWERARATKAEEDFYNEVVKFVRGEAHDIKPGTIGMIQAEIAKRLIAESPDLLAEDKRPDLMRDRARPHDEIGAFGGGIRIVLGLVAIAHADILDEQFRHRGALTSADLTVTRLAQPLAHSWSKQEWRIRTHEN